MLDFDSSYQDEFGVIAPHILKEANNLWHNARQLSLKILNDEHLGNSLLLKAAAKVTQKEKEENFVINDVRSYLFKIYKNLLFSELRKNNLHKNLEEQWLSYLQEIVTLTNNSEEENICRKILFDEIVSAMDDWTKKVFYYRNLGYEYKDLVPQFGSAENVIRSKFSRKVKEISLKLKSE